MYQLPSLGSHSETELHLSILVALKAHDLDLSLSISVHLPPPLSLPPPDHPYPHAVSSLHLSIHPSLRAAGGINISCSSCPRGYTSPSYRNPTSALLQLWPPTSQPCSGQSAQPPLSDPAGFAANGRPWQGSSLPEGSLWTGLTRPQYLWQSGDIREESQTRSD